MDLQFRVEMMQHHPHVRHTTLTRNEFMNGMGNIMRKQNILSYKINRLLR